jgi:hypothetical protein
MDRRTSGAIALGVVAVALTFWFARRRWRSADRDLYVAPRADWTPPHGDPLAQGRV